MSRPTIAEINPAIAEGGGKAAVGSASDQAAAPGFRVGRDDENRDGLRILFLDFSRALMIDSEEQVVFIGKSSTEGERKRKARLKNQEKIRLLEDTCLNNGGQMFATCPPENRDKRLDIRDKRIEGKEETQLSAPILYGEV